MPIKNEKKRPPKKHILENNAEIFSASLAVQRAQNVEFCSTQILLKMQDWISIQTGVYLLLSSASCSLTDPACTKVANKITLQLKT